LPAAVVGGLLVGFSPFMAGHLRGHLHLAFAALIPLMLMLIEDILWRHPRPDRRSAIYLGVVTAAQFGISQELVVITAIGIALALLAYLLVDARALWRAARAALRPMGIAILVTLVGASPLLIEQFVVGEFIHMHNAVWRATVNDYLLPSGNTIVRGFGHGHLNIGSGEDGVYLGPVLLAVLVGGVLISARDRLIRCAVVALAVLVALSFGDIQVMGIHYPWHYVEHLPGLSAVLPVRLSFASWLVIAWLVARWIDRLHASVVAPPRLRRLAAVAGFAALAGALVTIVPNSVNASALPPVPTVLTHPPASVPNGSPVLLLPSATPRDSVGMYFQQAANFRFVMPSGYAYRKNIDKGTLWAPQTPLERIAELPSRARPADLVDARAELARLHYRAVVVVHGLPGSQSSRDFAKLLLGRPPDQVDDQTWVWLLPG
jgi:cell shape-determining protein MreD